MKFMKMDPQNRLYSRDQVKVATLVIFFTFSEKFQLFYKKVDFHKKSFCKNRKNRKSCKNTLLPHLVARAGAPFPNFPQIMVKFTKFHQLLVNSC